MHAPDARPEPGEHDEAFFRSLVDLTHDLVFTATPEGRLTFVNAAVTRVLHYDAGELERRPALALVRKDWREAVLGFYRLQIERGLRDTYYELPAITRGGTTVWVGVHVQVRSQGGQVVEIRGAARDISHRRGIEEALRQSEERFRQSFDENLAGIYVAGPSGQIRTCNPAFVRIYGFPSLIDALGSNLATLYPAGTFTGLVERLRRDGAVHHHETTVHRVDGMMLHVIESLVGRFDDRGELVAVNGYVFDDTPRKDLESQVRQAQKMEALGRLAGGVAHDFNNILMVINGLSETVLEILGEESPVREDLVEILSAGRRAAALTSQLLAFSRKRVLLPTTFDVDDVMTSMEPMLRRLLGTDIALDVASSPEPKWITADRGQIEQVLLNLVANARDAMPDGGTLGIRTEIVVRPVEFGRDLVAAPEVVVRLSDTGQGMAPDVQARIFEPYFTTKGRGKGTGLGLSTVYAIVSESGGVIHVASDLGRGTTFTISLPLAPPPEFVPGPARRAGTVPVEGLTGRTITVLVVEDEMPVRQLVTNALRRAGYQVLTAEDARAALDTLQAHGAPIDLLLTDVIMPGKNGRELARDAQALQPGLPVLFMSGYADRTFGPDGPGASGESFLQKPFALEVLFERIERILAPADLEGPAAEPAP
jgi:PAS domain S-box-containing protein